MESNNIESIVNETKEKKTIANFMVLFFIASLLVIDFLPYFKSLEIINPQFLYLSLINLLIGIYFYFNSTLIAIEIFSIFKKSYIFEIYVAFLFFCAISIFSAKNVSLVITKFTELMIVFCLFVNLSILLRNKLNLFYKIVLIISISAFFQAWQQLTSFVIIAKNASIIDLLNNMKGNTGNINILAASLTIKVPFLLVGITYFTEFKRLFLLITLFSVTAVIFLTGARTPLINLFLIFFVYSIYLIKEYSFKRVAFIKILFLIIPVLISILFANIIFEKSKDKGRYQSLENRVGQIGTGDTSAQMRLGYWSNVAKMSKEHPFFGIGLGNYQIESIPYERTTANEFNVSLHAHNDFLEILAETGIVNGLIYLSLFVFILIINSKKILKSKNTNEKTIAMLTLMMLIIFGIDSIFNFPMYRPTMQIFFSLMLALTILNNYKLAPVGFGANTSQYKIVYIILIILSGITSYSAFIIYKASHLEYLIVSDDVNTKLSGFFLSGDEVLERMPSYPNVFQNSESFYEYAAIYYIREKNYEKAFKCFSKASQINPYMGRINFYKYIISMEKRNTDSAYVYSKQAFYLRPRNYQLYKSAIHVATIKKDTVEIFKIHKMFSQYNKMPEEWKFAAAALQNSGVTQKRLAHFIDQGLKEIPKDSTLIKQKNAYLITDYIMEGQKFEDQLKFDKALESYQKAVKLDSTNVFALQNIGFYYFNRGENKTAINYLENALKYPGLNNGKTEFFLGLCYLNINDRENGCKYLNISKSKKFANAVIGNPICK